MASIIKKKNVWSSQIFYRLFMNKFKPHLRHRLSIHLPYRVSVTLLKYLYLSVAHISPALTSKHLLVKLVLYVALFTYFYISRIYSRKLPTTPKLLWDHETFLGLMDKNGKKHMLFAVCKRPLHHDATFFSHSSCRLHHLNNLIFQAQVFDLVSCHRWPIFNDVAVPETMQLPW